MPPSPIPRHLAAIRRTTLGRPLRLALESGAIPEACDVLDYGCGHGDDVARLRDLGHPAVGWDPHYAPNVPRSPATACYLGFVLNVIEHPQERVEVLKAAWNLTKDALVVGTLVSVDARGSGAATPFGDGLVTRLGTFQKYFDQRELENLLRTVLQREPVALGMGAFVVFREPARAATLLARRVVRRSSEVPAENLATLLAERRELLQPLVDFFMERGRWPDAEEARPFDVRRLGSLARVTAALENDSTGASLNLAARRQEVRDDLQLVVALTRFRSAGSIPTWEPALRHELIRHFGSLREALMAGDHLLATLGNSVALRRVAAAAPVGKRMPDALYVHTSAQPALPKLLRLYEELGRSLIGGLDDANLVKLHLDHPAISYLSYPSFDTDAHPALERSFHVDLQTFRLHIQRFERNPPILHRKELFVASDYPQRPRFERLTRQEERWELYDGSTGSIGNRDQWAERLRVAGVRIVGHRLLRTTA